MGGAVLDLWQLVKSQPQIDPGDLAQAIVYQAGRAPLDYRTRLLIRDGVEALKSYWGPERYEKWLQECPARDQIEAIGRERFERSGFPSLVRRMTEKTQPEQIEQYLRELGQKLQRPLQVTVGGSAALILGGRLSRATEDIDIVDEVPAEVRTLYAELDRLQDRYGLQLTHFQSHYLPRGWEQRVHSLGSFGKLQVFLVDVYDVFLSKLFSAREKDRDDVRVLAPQLDRGTLVRRLGETAQGLLADDRLRRQARDNWYILFGEALPHDPDTCAGQGEAGRPRP